jgi:hypothetical protein
MRFIYLGLFFLGLISCSGSKMLQKSLQKYKSPIGYLHDTKIVDCQKSDTIFISAISNKVLDTITNVSKINGKVLPFIFFTYTETNMKVKLGQSSIEQSYNDFFINSLIDESKRSGCFVVDSRKPSKSQYSLEITIDTCNVKSKYKRSTTVLFLLFAYSMSFQEFGFPAETDLVVSAKLKKEDKIISEKSYNIKKTQPFLNSRSESVDKLRSDFTANMVESLSLSTKQCVEELIKDLNISKQDK